MTKKKQISCGAKSIVLTDEQMVDEINELLAKSDYNYNFNKLANDLLARGIDSFKVDDKPTEEVKPKEEEWEDRSESVQVCEFNRFERRVYDKRARRRPTEKGEKYLRIKKVRQERQDFEEFEKPRFWRSYFCTVKNCRIYIDFSLFFSYNGREVSPKRGT